VAAELRTLSATPFLGATGDGGAVLGTTGVVFGADRIEANQSLLGVARLSFDVDVGPGSPYTLRVALTYRDANGFNLEATLDDIEVVRVPSCPE
jgi:hypothetical protein